MSTLGLRHWAVALGGALAIHAGIALCFGRPAPSGAAAAGRGGLAVDLGSAGGSPGKAKAPAPDDGPDDGPGEAVAVPEAAAVVPVETAAVPPDIAPEVPEVSAAALPAKALPAEAVAAVPLYAPEATAAPVMATPAPPPPKPQRLPQKIAPPAAIAAAPAAPATEIAAIEAAAPAAGPQVGAPSEDALAGTGGKAGLGSTANAGDARGERAGGMPGQSADYTALLMAWLEKHKEYPRRAKLRRQEGTAQLHFVIDGAGRLLEFRIKKSSGYKLLDDAVVAMVQRAAPMPVPPPGMTGDRFSYTVPVLFNQR